MDFSKVSTVFFDLDWTLITSVFKDYILPDVYKAAPSFHRYTLDEFFEMFVSTERKFMPRVEAWDPDFIFKEMGLKVSALSLYRKYQDKLEVYPDVLPALDRLVKRYRLCVLTNSLKEYTDLKVEQTRISHYFEHIFTADQIGYAKPSPEIFIRVLKRMGLKNSNAIYVGDSPEMDVPGARKAGIATFIVNRMGKPIPDGLRPTVEIKTLTELPNHLGVVRKT